MAWQGFPQWLSAPELLIEVGILPHIRGRTCGERDMNGQFNRKVIVGACAALLGAAPVFAQTNEIRGIVVTNQHGHLTIKTPQGDQAIAVPPGTRVRSI